MTRHVLSIAFAVSTLTACGDDSSPQAPGTPPAVVFAETAAARGIRFAVDRAEVEDWFMPESIGCGCALFDADGDGDLDVYAVSGWCRSDGTFDTEKGRNRLWLQQPGGMFADATESSGLGDGGYGMGVAVGDIDNDGDLDVYVTNYGPDRLFRNDGRATFTDVTAESGIDNRAWAASAGFCDLDGDGWLDLFVTNYVSYDPARDIGRDPAGRPEYMGPETLKGVPDRLYRGVGGGKFKDVSSSTGIATKASRGLGLAFLDVNGDDRLDIYVANDRQANFAWVAKGDGTYEEAALRLRIGFNDRGAPEASMGVAVGDADGDGLLDLLLTHLVTETHTLYRQTSPGVWRDATAARGLGAATRNDTGWGCAFVDLDRDGDNDLVCINGRVMRGPVTGATGQTGFWGRYAQRDRVFVNDGSAFSKADMGSFTTHDENGRGLAVGDIDRDGDVDLLVSTANGTVRLFENRIEGRGRWLGVRVREGKLDRDVEGAVVFVRVGGRRRVGVCARSGSYLSSKPPTAYFGLPGGLPIEEVGVLWPGGRTESFGSCEADRRVVLERGKGR
ncbi:MAG: CRTAC1 family protein [Planctomycetes bacterium]|nr:CRTAC1 family protein [Planctomycetota bacterium]